MEKYTEAQVEIIKFDAEDVITSSCTYNEAGCTID